MNEKSKKFFVAALCLGVSLPSLALAQDEAVVEEPSVEAESQLLAAETAPSPAPALEKAEPIPSPGATGTEVAPLAEFVVAEDDIVAARTVDWGVRLDAEGYSSDNASFRKLDESRGDQEQRETDDRHTFGVTRLSARLGYDVVDDVTFRFAGSHSGMWGSSQLGGSDMVGGFFQVRDLSVNWAAVDQDAFGLGVHMGRVPFSIGGAARDYFFSDSVDGVVLNARLPSELGNLRILAVDFAAAVARPDSVNFGNWPSNQPKLVQNMRGDTNTLRFGGVYENTSLLDGLELRAFGFYSKVGAGGTGSDRTHHGTLANFSDNDFNWLAGARVGYFHELGAHTVGAYGEFARAGGIDRKDTNIGYHDVVIEGNAFGGALVGDFLFADKFEVGALVQYFHSDGPKYGADGQQFAHGFVGFKGSYAGGLNMASYAGWRPTAYLGSGGVHQSPHDRRRESGTQMLHGSLRLGLVDSVKLDLGVWHFVDTGSTNLNLNDVATIADRLPAGSSQDDLEAQERLGKTLGTELNARVSYKLSNVLGFYASGGIFLPGDFYGIEVTRKVGTSRGSDDLQNFWAVAIGTSLEF